MNQLGGYVWLLLWSGTIFSTAFAFMIIHGKNATDGEVPFQVSLRTSDEHVCGGVILNEHWVLTAGHCIYMLKLETVVYNSLLLSKGNTVSIKKTYLHPNFCFSKAHNDIGLIRTVTPIKLNQTNANPIKLPNARDHPNEGDKLTVSGWGFTSTNLTSTNRLQIVSIPVIDDKKCVELLKPLENPFLAEQMLCAGEKVDQSKGSCHGDSGGPATVNGVLQGLVSWREEFCTTLPSVYTRVAHHVDWIHQITGIPIM